LVEDCEDCLTQDSKTRSENRNVKNIKEAAVISDTYTPHKKNL
jgi:hypothetical protein